MMSDMPIIDEQNSNYVRLPYTLTECATATREGLIGDVERIGRLLDITPERESDPPVIPWNDAAERLLYREGQPWCHTETWDDDILCGNTSGEYGPDLSEGGVALHRLAAILCDDGESLRVLHWCVNNLSKEGLTNE